MHSTTARTREVQHERHQRVPPQHPAKQLGQQPRAGDLHQQVGLDEPARAQAALEHARAMRGWLLGGAR